MHPKQERDKRVVSIGAIVLVARNTKLGSDLEPR